MFYCPKCRGLRERDQCPVCGSKRLMAPRAGDFCFLEETERLWAGMLADVLKQAGIPCFEQSDLGAGLTINVGQARERIRFFVPFERLPEARNLADGLFHAGEE